MNEVHLGLIVLGFWTK